MENIILIMKLYLYPHCPFCVRVLTFAGLANIKLEQVILSNDDEETPIKMTGKKQLPILEADGKYITESLDIINFLNEKYSFLQSKVESKIDTKKVTKWIETASPIIYKLFLPRCIKLKTEALKTQSAIEYFTKNKEAGLKTTFAELIKNTPMLKEKIEEELNNLEPLINGLPSVKNRDFTIEDIMLFSTLRLLSVVPFLRWNKKVKDYMMHISALAKIPLFEQVD